MRPSYRLGINHHLLHPDSADDPAVHEATLAECLALPGFDAIDAHCVGDAAQREREAAMIRRSGRSVVYNTPLLSALPGCDPNAVDERTIERTRAAALPHLDAAAACEAHLVNVASGANPPPERRADAWRGWIDFLAWYGGEADDRGMRLVIEPFDQSIGKNLLIGPTADAVRSVENVHALGVTNVGLMVDMGHLPIMGESFEHALVRSAPYLWHVHLGSAVIRDPSHPWYGDCHPPLGIPEGEHDVADLAEFLRELVRVGYFAAGQVALTLEMRPYAGLTPQQSAAKWRGMLDQAWEMAERA